MLYTNLEHFHYICASLLNTLLDMNYQKYKKNCILKVGIVMSGRNVKFSNSKLSVEHAENVKWAALSFGYIS